MTDKEFVEELLKLGIKIEKEQLNNLEKYYNLLIEWNKKINLTRITNREEAYLKHFYDSLTIAKVIDLSNEKSLLDFGTGAGFPGLVLKIMYPNLKVTLVDSLQKRVNFLNEVINELDLKNIEAIHSRVEDLEKKHYDVITTRAVANLSKLIDYTNKLIDNDTKFIPLKSHVDDEINDALNKLKKYKLKIEKKEEINLPKENSLRNILIIKKD